MNIAQLVTHWCFLLLMTATNCVYMVTTTRAYREDWTMLCLLYPGGFLMWGCLVLKIVALGKYTSQKVINRRAS